MSVTVIKQPHRATSEPFDPEKLHASVRAACLSAQSPEGAAEMAAVSVTDAVIHRLADRYEITSHTLRELAADHLRLFHPDAAYLYEQQGTII